MSRQPVNGYRNHSNGSVPPQHSSMMSTPSTQSPSQNPLSRAERFEDEKRRIIESCFSKTDETGQLQESYITHIRIIEDGVYPSTPPPPDSAPENKKPRLIIIAVRNTGRVRMHKARENNNGSFSIGKTWNMEELSAIESFSNIPTAPRDDREAQYRTWAGSVGFIATITKPYYWQAGTSKEKDFFIASAVKIYKKYTKGMVPELRGFDDKDRAAILGTANVSQTQAQQSPIPPPHAPQRTASPAPVPPSLQPPGAREQSRDVGRYRSPLGPGNEPISREFTQTPPSRLQTGSPGLSRPMGQQAPRSAQPTYPPPSHTLKPFASSDQMRSQSRDQRPGARPDTSPGPGAPPQPYGASSSNSSLVAPPPPRAMERSDSPTIAGRSRSPAPNPFDERRNQPVPVPEPNGGSPGPTMFASTRQRVQPPQPLSTSRTPPNASSSSLLQKDVVVQSPTGAPQLPPLNIAAPQASAPPQRTAFSPDRGIPTAASDSSGLDSSDANAFGSIAGFWDGASAAAAQRNQPAVSPPTPERSTRRPAVETKPSDVSVDLRPAPLMSRRPAPLEPPTATDTNLTATRDVSAQPTPVREKTPPVKPLTVQSKPDSIAASLTSPRPPVTTSLASPRPPVSASLTSPRPPVVGGLTSPRPPVQQSVSPLAQQNAVSPLETPTSNDTPVSERSESEIETPSETFRPGLGPMIKKSNRKAEMAEKIRLAAKAANAFKPRPGGAAEKILKARDQREAMSEPDGITAVVPRPAAQPAEPVQAEPEKVEEPPVVANAAASRPVERKGVQLTDESPRPSPRPSPRVHVTDTEDQLPQAPPKVKRRSIQNERYLTELGIDRALLEGKGLEFETLLDEFGWRGGALSKSLIELEHEVKRELGRVEAGSWLSHTDVARDEKVQQVDALLDKAIAECDELDGLLTLYSVELGSLNEDIAYIEAQSQGLQVQSANQKVLHSELQTLVETMSLNRTVLEPLRYADLSQSDRLEEVEGSLIKLYDALITIDPSIKSTAARPASRLGVADLELSRMAALREKKEVYVRESAAFCQRLMQQLDFTFTTTLNGVKNSIMRPISGGNGVYRLNKDAFVGARGGLWMYSPVVQFTKEVNPPAWQTIIRMYYTAVSPLYVDAFKQNIIGWRRAARKASAEEAELLFTHQEKEPSNEGVGGLTSTARKLTVKRSQTLAKTLRNASGGDKFHSSVEARNPGALMSSEVYSACLDEMAPLVSQEQNFIVDMFHATSLETTDFIDNVAAAPPDERRGTNVMLSRPMEPDREMARRMVGVMEAIFGFFTTELTSLLDWTVTNDPLQAVGVMAGLSKHTFYLQESNQEFLLGMLDQLTSKLRLSWVRFVDEQVHAIEDTKVKIHKRKGVISFMKVFPPFSVAVENIFSAVAKADYDGADCMLEVRRLIDSAYAKINKAMFDSLKVIAKESPGAATGPAATKQGALDDPEDKEMLNYQILIIENMNHYIEEVDDGGREGVLAEWRGRAMLDRLEALEAYLARVIRRPLGKLLDFIESLESLVLAQQAESSIANRPSYSRKTARGILAQYDSKEIRRGIDTLRKRIEKHFAEGDEENISRSLVTFVNKECERSYEKVMTRAEGLINSLYPPVEGEKNVELEFTKEDVRTSFRR